MAGSIIRAAAPGDLDALLALYRHLNPADPIPDPARAAAAWQALLRAGFTTVFVAEADSSLKATCTLTIIPNLTRDARPYAVIENVVTHATHRRSGLGTAVMQTALDAAWAAGCYKVMLASGRAEPVLAFYETLGFRRGGKTFFEARRT